MEPAEHTLECLLAFDGRRHWYESGYHVRFQIRRVEKTKERPHGLRYSFTLHDPKGKRLVGFDNAHGITRGKSGRLKKKTVAVDHWHRAEGGRGRPYEFTDAAELLDDFFAEVERVLTERGIPFDVVETEEERN